MPLGTWLDSDSDRLEDGKISSPSNVTRLTRAIRSQSSDGIQQIVYYQAGVGSTGDIVNRVTGGATGQGVAENVREAYGFITNNYIKGDEIFLIGFSRGAFTARSVGGLIGGIGVLTKEGVAYFPIIYKVRDYSGQNTALLKSCSSISGLYTSIRQAISKSRTGSSLSWEAAIP